MPARVPTNIDARRLVGVHAEHVSNVSSKDFPGHYPGEDNSWDLGRFKKVSTLRGRLQNSSNVRGRRLS